MGKRPAKILIIRFSSFGDIVQSMSILDPLRSKFVGSEIHWATKHQFAPIIRLHTPSPTVWEYDPNTGLAGLFRLARRLREQNFSHIYDAHSHLRSILLCLCLRFLRFNVSFIRRPKSRIKRFLLFKLRINLFPKPFKGMLSYLSPLKPWGIEPEVKPSSWDFSGHALKDSTALEDSIAIAPSTAWPMKSWPVKHWIELIELLPQQKFILLGGPNDDNCASILAAHPDKCKNFSGKLTLAESAFVATQCKGLIAADTGLLHVADLLGLKAIGLFGPTAFGFPSGETVRSLGVELPCRPCSKDGRGRCSQNIYQACLMRLSPPAVAEALRELQSSS